MIDLYDISVVPYRQGLNALSAILRKAAEHAAERNIDPAALLGARLFPDMFPLTGQVQLACDHAKRGTARLLGVEAPRHADIETSFDEIQARIASTLDFIGQHERERFAGRDEAPVELQLRGATRALAPVLFLTWYSLPHFHFHLTTAYDILRHNGVPLGKRDYLGSLPEEIAS